MLYEAKRLKKVYDGRTVLDLPDFFLEAGKIHAVMGPNGAGKTTLLQILAFLISPSSGDLRFRGESADRGRQRLMELRRFAVLVEQFPILFSTTVFKNVEFGLKARGMPRHARQRIVEESLDLVGMGSFSSINGRHLSGGETQRVAIARALACRPEVILLDEPTSSVDVKHQLVIENIIRDIHVERRATVIFCTHSPEQATRLAQEKRFLYGGRTGGRFYENLFSGMAQRENGRVWCRLNASVVFPCPPDVPEGEFRFTVDPTALRILRNEKEDVSASFAGRVVQLSDEREWVRALVDVGVPLNLLVPKSDSVNRRLFIGAEVRLLCPEHAVIPV